MTRTEFHILIDTAMSLVCMGALSFAAWWAPLVACVLALWNFYQGLAFYRRIDQ
jgi:ABC-type bacteriocin/lantibiotic exporter with double-glycine peptidase domain